MSVFLEFLTEHTSLNNQLPYGYSRDSGRSLVKVGNGLLLVTEVYQDIGEGAKILVEHGDSSYEMDTPPLSSNPGLDKLARVIDVDDGYLDFDAFMRREANRSCSKADLSDRVEDLFLEITDWEDVDLIFDNIDVSIGFNGYVLTVFGTCIWLEDSPSPTIQPWTIVF